MEKYFKLQAREKYVVSISTPKTAAFEKFISIVREFDESYWKNNAEFTSIIYIRESTKNKSKKTKIFGYECQCIKNLDGTITCKIKKL